MHDGSQQAARDDTRWKERCTVKLVLARHGQSEDNVLNVFSNTGFKHPLTALGCAQAHELAAVLRDATPAIVHVYTSPLQRAVGTGQIVAHELEVPYSTHRGLVEFGVGDLEGRSDEAAWDEFGRLWRTWLAGDHAARIGGGESLSEVVARLQGFIDYVRADDHYVPSSAVLGISHGGTLLAALPLLVDGLSRAFPFELRFSNCDYVELALTPTSLEIVDTHLTPAEGWVE